MSRDRIKWVATSVIEMTKDVETDAIHRTTWVISLRAQDVGNKTLSLSLSLGLRDDSVRIFELLSTAGMQGARRHDAKIIGHLHAKTTFRHTAPI